MAEKKEQITRERISCIVERTVGSNGVNKRQVIINSEIPFNESTGEYFLTYDLADKPVMPAQYCNDQDSVALCFKNSGRKVKFFTDEIYAWTADNGSGNDYGKKIELPEVSGLCQFQGGWRARKDGKVFDNFIIRLKSTGLLISSDGVSEVEPKWDAA